MELTIEAESVILVIVVCSMVHIRHSLLLLRMSTMLHQNELTKLFTDHRVEDIESLLPTSIAGIVTLEEVYEESRKQQLYNKESSTKLLRSSTFLLGATPDELISNI